MDILTKVMRDMFADWPIGTSIGVLAIACMLFLVGLVIWSLFVAADSWFLPRAQKTGHIIAKQFIPGHMQTVMIFNPALNMGMPHEIFCPHEWLVSVEIEGQQDSISVSKEFFDSVSGDNLVVAEFVRGRFSGDLYLKGLFY